jgi:hypothetical protein
MITADHVHAAGHAWHCIGTTLVQGTAAQLQPQFSDEVRMSAVAPLILARTILNLSVDGSSCRLLLKDGTQREVLNSCPLGVEHYVQVCVGALLKCMATWRALLSVLCSLVAVCEGWP